MAESLLVVAGLGAIAFIVGKLAKRVIPEIVIFLALGVLIGPEGPVQLINERNIRSLELLTQIALGAIIFLIGDRLRLDQLRGMRRQLGPVNVAQLCLTAGLVYVATQLAGADARVSILLAIIAAETGVLTVTATVAEQRARGRVSDLLLTSVGITNVVVAAAFGLVFPFLLSGSGEATGVATVLVFARLVLASSVIGLLAGWVLARAARTIEASGELLLLLLIVLTAVVGLDIAIQGSVILSTLVSGLYLANTAPWIADRLFAAVRILEAPIYLVFFVVAGASVHVDELAGLGMVGGAYLVARLVGKVLGATIGGVLADRSGGAALGSSLGLGLLPHAGMAIAIVATVVEQAPGMGAAVSPVVLGSIVIFELSGPFFIRRAIRGAAEAGQAPRETMERAVASPVHTGITRVLIPVGSIDVLMPRVGFLLDLVGNLGAELVAVHISRPGSGLGEHEEPEVLALVRRLSQERNIPCTTVHRVAERIAPVLVGIAREENVSLIVMGQPVRTSVLEPAHWGRVAQRVLRDSEVPVLVYPVDPTEPARAPAPYLRRAQRAEAADAEAGNVPTDED